MIHRCHAVDCEREILPSLLMCFGHWHMLAAPAQRIVRHHYRAGQEKDKAPGARYVLAASVARALVAVSDRKWSARQALERVALSCRVARHRGVPLDEIAEMVRAMGAGKP